MAGAAPVAQGEQKARKDGLNVKLVQQALSIPELGITKAEAAWFARLLVAASRELKRTPALMVEPVGATIFAKAFEAAVETVIREIEQGAKDADAPEVETYNGMVVEYSKGEGLGKILKRDESVKMLSSITVSPSIESWAGPVLGPVQIEKRFGIPRSTLASWHAANAVIGIKRGLRRHEYPVEQFIDGRPLDGIAQVLKIAPTARSAWAWLRGTREVFDGATPLQMLEIGKIDEVIEAAHRDFDEA